MWSHIPSYLTVTLALPLPKMFTSGATTKPRRKPATYGKASGRTLQAYHAVPPGQQGGYYRGDGNEDRKKIIGQIKKDGAAPTHKAHSGSPQTSIGAFTCQGGAPNKARERSATPGSTATPSVASPENNNIYDVPSCDDNSGTSLELRVNGSRKKRKVDDVGTKELSDAIWDDASLQQHIAAEMGETAPRLISLLEHQDSGISQSLKTHSKPVNTGTRRSRERSKVLPGQSAGGKPKKVTKRPASGVGTSRPRSRTIHQQRVPAVQDGTQVPPKAAEPLICKGDLGSPVSGTGARTLAQIPPPYVGASPTKADGLCTPQRAFQSGNGLATTRGNHIRPFRDNAQLSSPEELNILGLHIKSSDTGSDQTAANGMNSYLGHQLQHSTTPRTKLKDRLHGGSKPAPMPNKDDEDDDTHSDSQPSILSTKRLPLNRKVRRNGSKDSRDTSREGPQQAPSSQPGPRVQNGGPKITYSRQRSYLTESDWNEAEIFTLSDISSQETNSGRSRTRSRPPKLQQLQSLSEEIDEASGSQAGAPKSIHELREAGTNARVLRDIEALLDDIDSGISSAIALKRIGILDIATKLQQPEFCRRFLDHGLETRLFAQFGKSTDVVANILLMGATLPILAHSSSPHVLSQLLDRRAVDFLGRYLHKSQNLTDMVQSRELKMSEALQADIGSFCASLLVSDTWRDRRPSQITGRAISLQCLEYIVRHLREAGSTSDLVPQTLVERLVDILAQTQEAFPSALGESHVTDSQLAVSILESSTITQPVSSDEEHLSWSVECVEKMEKFLARVQEGSAEGFETLRTLALRLCLNLTNNSRARCETFSTPRVIYTSLSIIESSFRNLSAGLIGEFQALTIDNLVLSLGLLTNLAEWSQSSRELYTTKHGAMASPLDTLSRLFLANLARTSEVCDPSLAPDCTFIIKLIFAGDLGAGKHAQRSIRISVGVTLLFEHHSIRKKAAVFAAPRQ